MTGSTEARTPPGQATPSCCAEAPAGSPPPARHATHRTPPASPAAPSSTTSSAPRSASPDYNRDGKADLAVSAPGENEDTASSGNCAPPAAA
ncbi:FG-GAP repeat protein [Streptomyces sp. MC1]|uniref:FG-GAP repeat protein n=1 Tax=Streptomyces sp. MC1 TaxID=295105 RepID=UPI001E3BB256|nr:FG-GAP repeat protein [Streptomyces sp. MC1]